jgi:two-component system CheB/CheR fusion protein
MTGKSGQMKKSGKQPRGKETSRKQKSIPPEKSSQPPVEKSSASTSQSLKILAPGFPIVGIGASAGGLEAFTQLLKHLPPDTGMGFVLVQHLDPDHESALAQILTRVTSMPVREVQDELRIAPNHVYIIPPNTDMATSQGELKLQRRKAGRAPHHSIDFFFESLAEDQHERAIGVILSGTASDGTLGTEAIKSEGGITFAQDKSARYDSMPRSAIAAGCVDFVLSPEHIARELARIARHPYVAGRPLDAALSPSEKKEQIPAEKTIGGQNGFKTILTMLLDHSGVDFSLYKSTTVHRRIARRMLLNKIDRPAAYANFLRNTPKELEALYSDLLISVTGFFRNPEAFDVLKEKVFPKLITEPRDKPLRVWALGCSTGQEAYSIAMAFVEFSDQVGHARKLQLFATDINEALLDKARAGLYAKNLVQDVSPERLHRFFVEEDGGYRVAKFLREMIVFARQNLLTDPPFSQMDLVSCRNVLIYIEQDLQPKILPTLHYALKPGGFLFLGESESTGPMANLFETVDKKHKIFSKKPGLTAKLHFVPRHPAEKKEIPVPESAQAPKAFPGHVNTQREADRVALNRFAPPSVLIDAQLQVLQFRGDTSLFLKPPIGGASFHVLKMAREGLMLPLRNAIKKANAENKGVRREGVRVAQNGGRRVVNFEVVPLTHLKERCCLIFFEQAHRPGLRAASASKVEQDQKIPGSRASAHRLAELEREVSETRDYLQSIQEQYEAANEELQSSNEEVTSANEELQSLNEELETSKEELESTNEELTTVNDEMANRNAELTRTNADLNNLSASVNMAIVLLTRDLAIRRFSPLAEKFFNLTAGDVGRPLSNVRHNLDLSDSVFEQMLQEVIHTASEPDHEVRDREGHWYSLRVRPYRTFDKKIDGAVLVLVDIDALKRSEREIAAARDYAEAIVRTTRYPFVILTADLRIHTANPAFYKTFKVLPGETNGSLIYELGNGQWNIPKLREFLEDILPRHSFFDDFEVTHDFESIGRRTMLLNARQLNTDDPNAPKRILLAIDDITESKLLEAVCRSEIRYRRLFEAAKDGVLIVDPHTRRITDANPFMTEMLGYTREEFLEKELCEIGLFPNLETCDAAFRELRQKGVFRDDNLRVETKVGETRTLEMASNLYEEEGHQVIQCNVRDITTRKQAEEDRRQLLAREQAARQEAEAANRAKDDFLATVSHELRTPLSAILGWSRLLCTQKPDGATAVRGLESIERNAMVQAQLIEDILDVSRIVAGKMSLESRPIDLAQIINAAIDTARPAADAKSIQIQTHFDPDIGLVSGDPGRIQQVVWNLLSNAVKFTPNGGRVDIQLERLDSDAQITVSDTGKGISADFLPVIFDRFRQADSTSTRQYGGLGLGLAIVRQIVEMHGGSVRAESRGEGQGATFAVRMPIKGIAGKENATPRGRLVFPTTGKATPFVCPPQIYGVRVLLVDDQPDTLEMLRSTLEQQCGAEVRTSADVATALEMFEQSKPDVLVSDIAMPGEDGYALIAKVRALEQQGGKRTPAIALTAYVRVEDRARALHAGYDRFVPKPIEPDELLATLVSLVIAE